MTVVAVPPSRHDPVDLADRVGREQTVEAGRCQDEGPFDRRTDQDRTEAGRETPLLEATVLVEAVEDPG